MKFLLYVSCSVFLLNICALLQPVWSEPRQDELNHLEEPFYDEMFDSGNDLFGGIPFSGHREYIPYSTKLNRFKIPYHDYHPCNAAALVEINFNVSIASTKDDMHLTPPPGFDQTIPILGKDPITHQDSIFAYILKSQQQNLVVLSLIGTGNLTQKINNFDFFQTEPTELNNFHSGIRVERGFYRIYKTIYKKIRQQIAAMLNEDCQLIISGHSLGGAIATLAAFDLSAFQPIVYTFASPRPGNPSFAEAYNRIPVLSDTWRIFNTEDTVVSLPPPTSTIFTDLAIYEHIGNPVPFTVNTGDQEQNHVEAYHRVIVQQLLPVNPNGICPSRFDCSKKPCLRNE